MHPTVVMIRNTINSRSISYSKLSEMSGIGLSRIKRIMSGHQKMTLEDRDQLFAALSISEFSVSADIRTSEYISIWNKMSPRSKHALLSLMVVMDSEAKKEKRG
ncbi:hypothetical protein [Vibrio quintilis]|uniref:HTH cro/C1-type domain-containing protein n=1 Tax=Vibrio quintilis TaxID=1117707 RepID=A0A1M7YP88_9VIBR|nr:hypothetical protein [Vibrio quintilis]SHO54437.1 hypothetical protein VQ7734_00151 [Vibrio quintilis]